MIPVEAAVNSSMLPSIAHAVSRSCLADFVRNPRASVSTFRLVMQRNKRRVRVHNSPKRERYLAAILPSR